MFESNKMTSILDLIGLNESNFLEYIKPIQMTKFDVYLNIHNIENLTTNLKIDASYKYRLAHIQQLFERYQKLLQNILDSTSWKDLTFENSSDNVTDIAVRIFNTNGLKCEEIIEQFLDKKEIELVSSWSKNLDTKLFPNYREKFTLIYCLEIILFYLKKVFTTLEINVKTLLID